MACPSAASHTRRPSACSIGLSEYFKLEHDKDFICGNGTTQCVPEDLPNTMLGSITCHLNASAWYDLSGSNDTCINWNQYYTKCRPGVHNPFQGAISFDNIGLAWVAIFQVSPRRVAAVFSAAVFTGRHFGGFFPPRQILPKTSRKLRIRNYFTGLFKFCNLHGLYGMAALSDIHVFRFTFFTIVVIILPSPFIHKMQFDKNNDYRYLNKSPENLGKFDYRIPFAT